MADRPEGLGDAGRALWDSYADLGLSEPQKSMLAEACRARDRLDKLDAILRGDVDTWARLTHRLQTQDYELKIDDALAKANTTATSLRQILAALPPVVAAPKARNALDELKARREARQPGTPSRARGSNAD